LNDRREPVDVRLQLIVLPVVRDVQLRLRVFETDQGHAVALLGARLGTAGTAAAPGPGGRLLRAGRRLAVVDQLGALPVRPGGRGVLVDVDDLPRPPREVQPADGPQDSDARHPCPLSVRAAPTGGWGPLSVGWSGRR